MAADVEELVAPVCAQVQHNPGLSQNDIVDYGLTAEEARER